MQATDASAFLAEACLRYPEPLGVHPQVTYESAVQMLLKAHQIAMGVPFQWGYIDRPQDGSLHLIFVLPQQRTFPNDGIRYQSQETRYSMPAGSGRELEVSEAKFGFIPDSGDAAAYRTRRRFRLIKGGSAQLMLIHYSAGHQMPIIPALRSQPMRAYPLRTLNEPAMYVLGEKAGQKVFPPQHHSAAQAGHVSGGMAVMAGMNGGIQHQASMLAHQAREMEALERRQLRDRSTTMSGHNFHDDDSGDEYDHISNRSLALARYKRNHEFMNEVFIHAAFGDKNPKPRPNPYACFNEEEVREKIAKLAKEVEALQAQAAEWESARRRNTAGYDGTDGTSDFPMDIVDSALVDAT